MEKVEVVLKLNTQECAMLRCILRREIKTRNTFAGTIDKKYEGAIQSCLRDCEKLEELTEIFHDAETRAWIADGGLNE